MWLDLAMFLMGLFWVVMNAVVVIAASGCGFGMGLFWIVFLVVVVTDCWLVVVVDLRSKRERRGNKREE